MDHEIFNKIKEDNVRFIQLQFSDILGLVKNVTIPLRELASAFEHGIWFDGSSIEGFARIAESDMYLKPDQNTYAVIPWLNSKDGNTARFICDIFNPDSTPFEGCPRRILKKAIEEAASLGYTYNTGPELEFHLFKKNEQGEIKPLPYDRAGYFDLTTDQAYEIRREMTITLEKFGIYVETTHHEVAVGQHEINFKFDNALTTADNAITLRFVLKAIAQKYDLHATFMPKPIAGIAGNAMHVHQSLFNVASSTNAFYHDDDKYNLSKTAYNFIGGQLEHIKGMAAILSPTVNSYKRLVPGYEAPVYISWARTNRSSLIRIPCAGTKSRNATRVELRCPDPTCNIYLAFAVMLKTGLDGIKRNILPPMPREENLYEIAKNDTVGGGVESLPESLGEALEELKNNRVVQSALGDHIVERYIEAKAKEWEKYCTYVSPWEIDRYLEQY
ncbi:glutamine synthetase family protein [Patescibacteria group bacterium]|nr:glutamine synthetase family protein [Patescibacteria group bacterium]